MFVLMVYDIDIKRVVRVLKTARRYLRRVQNSVFEGEISPGRLASLKADLAGLIEPEYDSVLFYTWRTEKDMICTGMGISVRPSYASGKAVNFI